jgi:site-specific DNA recombinase
MALWSELRNEDGTYRRDHLRALAQRVEVVDPSEIRILGTKTELLRTLVAAAGVESAAGGVRSFIPKWRTRQDSNLWPPPSEGGALSS